MPSAILAVTWRWIGGEVVSATPGVAGVERRRRRGVEHIIDRLEVGARVLETANPQIGGGDVRGRGSEHPRTLVDADQLRLWVEVEHPARRLLGADPKLENPLGPDTGSRLGDGILQLVVRRHLLTNRLEIGGGGRSGIGHRLIC
jgi:hypothetical protein